MDRHHNSLDAAAMQTDTTASGADQISVLRSVGPLLTKRWKASGEIQQYDDALHFKLQVVAVDGIHSLSKLLVRLEADPHACIIRGRYVGDERAPAAIEREVAKAAAKGEKLEHKPGTVLRRNTLFDDQRLHMILIEVDKYQSAIDPLVDPEGAIALFINEKLPRAFRDATCHWQLSSSAGHASKGGELRAHLWFWLKTPYSSEELRAWARHERLEIDASVFRQVQPHFTAKPVFDPGVADPVSRRSGLMQSPFDLDEVDLDLGSMLAARQARLAEAAAEAARKRAERAARDPEGASIVEAFNARHSIEDMLLDTDPPYEHDGNGNWRSPYQDSGSYATRVYDDGDGQYWVSLSGSDAEKGIGFETKSGARAGDAFDLLVHFTHKGNWAAAMAAANVATAVDDFRDISNDPEVLAAQAEWDAAQETLKRHQQKSLDAFAPFSAATLAGKPVPERKWHVPMVIPAGTVTGLAGDGGIGKSLLALQLAVATAVGGTWVGLPCAKGRALYIGAEDDHDEMHKRLGEICAASGLDMADLTDLEIAPMAGFDTVLAEAKRSGKVEGTKLWQKVRAHVERTRPTLIVFDTLADLFAGDENVRTQAQQFVGLLRGLCVEYGATALLLTHPSLSGMASGTGMSGSTAWNNSVRSRLYLTKPDKAPEDTDLRVLSIMKNNYGKRGDVAKLRWVAGAFLPVNQADQAQAQADQRELARERFLEMLDKFTKGRMNVSQNPGPSFAPARFHDDPDGNSLSKTEYATAMRELLEDGAIESIEEGPVSRRRSRLVRGTTGGVRSLAVDGVQDVADGSASDAPEGTPNG